MTMPVSAVMMMMHIKQYQALMICPPMIARWKAIVKMIVITTVQIVQIIVTRTFRWLSVLQSEHNWDVGTMVQTKKTKMVMVAKSNGWNEKIEPSH